VSQIIGSPVRLKGANEFGRVEDVVLNERTGETKAKIKEK
jgi:hypothetical protein